MLVYGSAWGVDVCAIKRLTLYVSANKAISGILVRVNGAPVSFLGTTANLTLGDGVAG